MPDVLDTIVTWKNYQIRVWWDYVEQTYRAETVREGNRCAYLRLEYRVWITTPASDDEKAAQIWDASRLHALETAVSTLQHRSAQVPRPRPQRLTVGVMTPRRPKLNRMRGHANRETRVKGGV